MVHQQDFHPVLGPQQKSGNYLHSDSAEGKTIRKPWRHPIPSCRTVKLARVTSKKIVSSIQSHFGHICQTISQKSTQYLLKSQHYMSSRSNGSFGLSNQYNQVIWRIQTIRDNRFSCHIWYLLLSFKKVIKVNQHSKYTSEERFSVVPSTCIEMLYMGFMSHNWTGNLNELQFWLGGGHQEVWVWFDKTIL